MKPTTTLHLPTQSDDMLHLSTKMSDVDNYLIECKVLLQFQNMAHFLPTMPSYKLSHMDIIITDDGDGLLYKPNKHSNVHSKDLIILSMFL